MSNWKLIVPQAGTNLVENTSAETNATGYNKNNGVETLIKTSDQSFSGASSIYLETTALVAVQGWFYPGTGVSGIPVSSNTAYTASAEIRTSFAPIQFIIKWYNAGGGLVSNSTLAVAANSGVWVRHELTATSPATAVFATLQQIEAAASATPVSWNSDSLQLELGSEATTIIDGDKDGCEWTGTPHASTSTRDGQSRAGGVIKDFADDYYFKVRDVIDTGAVKRSVNTDSYAILPGSQLNSIKEVERVFTLIGVLRAPAPDCDLNQIRQDLIDVLEQDAYPKGSGGWQPIRVRYTGADVTKEIQVHYEGGLDVNWGLANWIHEKTPIRFRAPGPYWYGLQDMSTILDTQDTLTMRFITGRLRSTGQWDDLGLTADPTTGGPVRAMLYNPNDGKLYIAGLWTELDGVAGRDYVARYDIANGTWETVGGASDFNGAVNALALGPDGVIYAGGAFTTANGDADAAYFAQLASPSAANWTAVAAGGTGEVRALEVIVYAGASSISSINYDVVIGGNFINWDTDANSDGIVRYQVSPTPGYSSIGTGVAGGTTVFSLAWYKGRLYAGGTFVTIGGVTANGVAYTDDLSTWNAMGDGLGGLATCLGLDVDSRGILYVVGDFTTADSIASPYAARFNGTIWSAMGNGLADVTFSVVIAPDGDVIVSGNSSQNPSAAWNGAEWYSLDFVNTLFAGVPFSGATEVGPGSQPVNSNYDLFFGLVSSASSFIAGIATVNNPGTANAKPIIYVNRSGGTKATFYSVRNERSGRQLYAGLAIADGETIKIDLRSTRLSTSTDWRGEVPDMLLKSSDAGQFSMLPGNNDVTALVYTPDATITAWLTFKAPYKSFD